MAKTSKPARMPARTTARSAAFMPCESPPLVTTPMRRITNEVVISMGLGYFTQPARMVHVIIAYIRQMHRQQLTGHDADERRNPFWHRDGKWKRGARQFQNFGNVADGNDFCAACSQCVDKLHELACHNVGWSNDECGERFFDQRNGPVQEICAAVRL